MQNLRPAVCRAEKRVIAGEQRTLVERLLREKISLHGICRAVGVRMKWLMHFMVARFDAVPDHLHVHLPDSPTAVTLHRLEAEADEIWSFVGKKANKQWLWLATDAKTRQVIAFHVGDRSRSSAEQLWANIPAVYREQATFYTDQYDAYKGVIPAAQHKAITKKRGKPTTSNASTIPYGSASPVSCVTRSPSPRSSPITLGPLSTSYVITTLREPQHYLDNTTGIPDRQQTNSHACNGRARKHGSLDVRAGQAVIASLGEWVRYGTPEAGGAECVAICLPAFSPETVHRDPE